MVFASIEFARVLMIRQALTNAVREGCRDACLATTQDSSTSETVIRERLRKVIADVSDEEVLRISFDPEFNSGLDSLTTISAVVEVDCSDVSWFPLTIFSNTRIRCSAQMLRE